jgi:hypothetical protein
MNDAIKFCSKCGSEVSPTARFCPKCGRPMAIEGSSADTGFTLLDSPQALEWEIAFPLLTNRFFLYDMAKLLFWTFLIVNGLMLTIFLIQREFDALLPMVQLSGLIILGFALLAAAITAVIFGNRFPTRFAVRPDGVFYESLSGRASTLNRAAIVAGILAGKPGAAGAGLLAASQETGGIIWHDVRTVHEYPNQCVISLMNSWRVVLRLYCRPEDYPRVIELVHAYAAAGSIPAGCG